MSNDNKWNWTSDITLCEWLKAQKSNDPLVDTLRENGWEVEPLGEDLRAAKGNLFAMIDVNDDHVIVFDHDAEDDDSYTVEVFLEEFVYMYDSPYSNAEDVKLGYKGIVEDELDWDINYNNSSESEWSIEWGLGDEGTWVHDGEIGVLNALEDYGFVEHYKELEEDSDVRYFKHWQYPRVRATFYKGGVFDVMTLEVADTNTGYWHKEPFPIKSAFDTIEILLDKNDQMSNLLDHYDKKATHED